MKRLFKQNINTFRGLGDPGIDSKTDYRLTKVRLQNTINFIGSTNVKMGHLLDIAGPSPFGKDVAAHYMSDKLYSTEGDLDVFWKTDCNSCDTVLMFEVIEHLLNPYAFFRQLKSTVDFKDMLLSWPCRPSWLWSDFHFHELRLDRFEYLLKLSGYEMVKYTRMRLPETWYNKFKGIRPIFRYFVNYQYFAHIRKL